MGIRPTRFKRGAKIFSGSSAHEETSVSSMRWRARAAHHERNRFRLNCMWSRAAGGFLGGCKRPLCAIAGRSIASRKQLRWRRRGGPMINFTKMARIAAAGLISFCVARADDQPNQIVTLCSLAAMPSLYDQKEVVVQAQLQGQGDTPMRLTDERCLSSSLDLLDFDSRVSPAKQMRTVETVRSFQHHLKSPQMLEVIVRGVFVNRHGRSTSMYNAIRPISIDVRGVVRGTSIVPPFPGVPEPNTEAH
jgi:hypothetical protein